MDREQVIKLTFAFVCGLIAMFVFDMIDRASASPAEQTTYMFEMPADICIGEDGLPMVNYWGYEGENKFTFTYWNAEGSLVMASYHSAFVGPNYRATQVIMQTDFICPR